MHSGNETRLILLCGAGLVTMQLAAEPSSVNIRDFLLPVAIAQEVSCFVPGTLVLMADGSQRPIEGVVPGDRVLGRRGQVNRVVGCERTRLGGRRLYGFNGARPFVTAEHPFLTSEGWRALDPDATRRETVDLPVLPLQVGDRLCRGVAHLLRRGNEREHFVFAQATTALEAVTAVAGEPSTSVFNLLLDGDHSYVANGWIVHNKDPEAHDPIGTDAPKDASAAAAAAGSPAQPAAPPGGVHAPSEAPSSSVDALLKNMGFSSSRDAGLAPAGPPLSPDQEQSAIEQRWKQSE